MWKEPSFSFLSDHIGDEKSTSWELAERYRLDDSALTVAGQLGLAKPYRDG